MSRSLVGSVVAAFMSAGCAASSRSSNAPPASPAVSPAPAAAALASTKGTPGKVVCQVERPVGSHISETVCRTQEQIDAERQAAQDAIHLMPKLGEGMRP